MTHAEGSSPISPGARFAAPGNVFGLASARGDLLVGTAEGSLQRVPAGPAGSVFVYDPALPAAGAPTTSPTLAGTVSAEGFVAGAGGFAAAGDLALSAPGHHISAAALPPSGPDDLVTLGFLSSAALLSPAPGAAPLVLLASAPFAASTAGAVSSITIPAGLLFIPHSAVVWCSAFAAPTRGGSDSAVVTFGEAGSDIRITLAAPAAVGAAFALSFPLRDGSGPLPAFAGDVPVAVASRLSRAGAGLRWRAGLSGFLL